jgi:5-(carboxyamino)imidazole ribonucleotide mutase
MPSGVPVGCMAIGKSGATNAALFSIQILGIDNKILEKKLLDYKKNFASAILKK